MTKKEFENFITTVYSSIDLDCSMRRISELLKLIHRFCSTNTDAIDKIADILDTTVEEFEKFIDEYLIAEKYDQE